jgi:hypothetical protein
VGVLRLHHPESTKREGGFSCRERGRGGFSPGRERGGTGRERENVIDHLCTYVLHREPLMHGTLWYTRGSQPYGGDIHPPA